MLEAPAIRLGTTIAQPKQPAPTTLSVVKNSSRLGSEMNLSPLQMLHYYFRGFSVVSRERGTDWVPPSPDKPFPRLEGDDLDVQLKLGELENNNTDPQRFLVSLLITSKKREQIDLPYEFAVQIEGLFSLDHPSDDLDFRKRLVVINGGSMLFGVAREQMLALTARHANGPMMFPSLDFRSFEPAPRAEDEQATEAHSNGT